MRSPDVVLLRWPDDPDPYVNAFNEANLTATCEPVLRFAFPSQDVLRDRLESPNRYGGLIATSPRAGQALHRVFRTASTLRKEWGGRPAYAVGPKTGQWLRRLGLDVQDEGAGTASDLVSVIVDSHVSRPLLFLCGSRRRDELPNGLREAGIPLREQVVYETRTRSEVDLPGPSAHPWLVFFSPSGLEAVEKTVGRDLTAYRLATIGPTTAGHLRSEGYDVEAVADEPTPEALVDVLRSTEDRRNRTQ